MSFDNSLAGSSHGILRNYLLIAIGWTILVVGSLVWNIRQMESDTWRTATATARATLAKDISFRNWVGHHGGVYVPPTETTPSNPYLHVPQRDVVTTDGKVLTLMNPAYVIREVQQSFGEDIGIKSHLTSLKIFNPGNVPDAWETEALISFDQGKKEALSISAIDGKPYLRLMLPLPVTENCMKCHAKQGYKIGDNRGGIGASILLEPYLEVERLRRNELTLTHVLILVFGLLGMLLAYRRQCWSTIQQEQTTAELLKLSQAVEQSPIATVITDLNANIEYVNEAFVKNTGYSRQDVLGKNPRILRSGKTPAAAFQEMWARISQGEIWEGELVNKRKDGSEYVEWGKILPVRGADGRVGHYLAVKEDITQRKLAIEEITHLAFYDHLTELPNRRLMLDRLKQALASSARQGRHGALMLIDLDNFKTLNDTQGHAVGDQLLLEVASRLKSSIRDGDTVARLGGDEFVVILEGLDAGEPAAVQAEGVAVKLLAKLRQPFMLSVGQGGYEINKCVHHCTSSVGITLFGGQTVPVDELMKRADTAMYQAKAAGRDTLRFFDPDMQTAVSARAAMEIDLRHAIVEEQFLLVYQPQVDATGHVTGAEALVRWQHPDRGMVSPAEFIPLAEETGLILPLGHWVLQTACIQLAAWAQRPERAHLTVAVNVSARQFSLPNLVEETMALVDYTGAPPNRLKLELTESLLLENADDIISKMTALKARGVSFSLDDFGTGYSSLSYLKRLPLDQLKIDQSFVRDVLSDPNDAAIARTIVALGQSLGLAVIAEGVETEAQRDFLASNGCLNYQGYFFSRPLTLEAFEAFLDRSA
ncbi:MAG: EAL domain-containing protein [Azonexus sp.]|nr:EAL domain-containing protein [Azonexus sp.]